MKEKSDLISNIRQFKHLKDTAITKDIAMMSSGINNYVIEHFEDSEVLQEYIDILGKMYHFQINDKFTYYLYCLAFGALSAYFSNQYDDQYYKMMSREMNRHKKYSIDLKNSEDLLITSLTTVFHSDLSPDDIIIILKLEF